MMNLDINEHLEKREYEDNLDYNDMIYAKINEGYHDLVLNFLKKVPNTDRKGKIWKVFINIFCILNPLLYTKLTC